MDVMVSKINGSSCLEASKDLAGRVVDLTVVDLKERKVRVRVKSENDLRLLSTGCGLRLTKENGGVFGFERLDDPPF